MPVRLTVPAVTAATPVGAPGDRGERGTISRRRESLRNPVNNSAYRARLAGRRRPGGQRVTLALQGFPRGIAHASGGWSRSGRSAKVRLVFAVRLDLGPLAAYCHCP